ncbi:unnamed protein product [Cunninghamella blakesleeana]
MIPRLPPIILLAIGSAAVAGAKKLIDNLETKAIVGSPEQQQQAIRRLQTTRRIGYVAAGSILFSVGYYGYHSWKERPSPSTVKVDKDDPNFHENQYAIRDKHNKENDRIFEEMERQKEANNLKRLQHEYIDK